MIVAESGFSDARASSRELAEAGVDAVLMGEALMRSPTSRRPAGRSRALRRSRRRSYDVGVASDAPKIKFCGITSLRGRRAAVRRRRLGDRADLLAGVAAALLARGGGGDRRPRCRRRVEVVGVFVNPTLDEVAAIAEAVGLTMLQLHGDEGPAFCAEAARRTGCQVIKAARVRSGADIQALSPFHTDFHLLDSYAAGQPGGTGETFAWELARAHRGRCR